MYRGVRNRKQLLAGLSLVLASVAMPALAHEAEADEPRATLSAEASSEVAQDTVEITLAAELSGASQTEVADALNQRLDSVMKQAKGHQGIEARSGSYRIWPTTDREGKIAEWRGQAEILLESRDFPAVSKLAASLGDRMPISGLSFSVSRERRAAEEQKLLAQAVDAFKARAQALEVYMPLVAGLHAILFEGRTLAQVIELLMRGEPKTDVDFISINDF